MIKIAIIDDLAECRVPLAKAIKIYDTDIVIDEYSGGSELLKSDVLQYPIIFLDIEMPEINGLDLADLIIESNPSALIIYTTSHSAYVTQAIRKHAYQFLIKPVSDADVKIELERAMNEIQFRKKILHINWGNEEKILNIADIIYVESNKKKIRITMSDGVVNYTSMRLCELAIELQRYNFVQCHKSYLVRLDVVKSIVSESVMLVNGEDVPVSRRYRQEFKKALNFYMNEVSI